MMKNGNKAGQLEMRKIEDLKHHPSFAGSPMLEDSDPTMTAMMAAIQDAGRPDPLTITIENLIVDGRHRARCCAMLGIEEVPVSIIPESDVEGMIVSSLLARRHMYRWQCAYTLAPIFEKAAEAGKAKRIENLKRGTLLPSFLKNTGVSGKHWCLSDLLAVSGVEVQTWERVRKVRQCFAENPHLRQRFEPLLFTWDESKRMSLEGVIKALGSIIAYESGQPTPKQDRNEHDRLAKDWAKKLSAQMKQEWWKELGSTQRKQVADALANEAITWPEEVQDAIADALERNARK